jgi:hypothetical protein
VHTCKENNCTRPQFGGGYCSYHQYVRRRQGGDLYKPKPRKQAPIKKRSEKRAKDERYYAVQAKEFFEDSDKKCFFCENEVKRFEGLHHFKGRTNNYLLDKRWWVVTHNDCHVSKWHRMTQEKFKLWLGEEKYERFLSRLKALDEELWRKQIGKSDKLNPTFDFNEELF